VCQRLGTGNEVLLLFQIGLALFTPLCEELTRLCLNGIGRLAVAMPQGLGLRARRLRRLFPALLNLVKLASRLDRKSVV